MSANWPIEITNSDIDEVESLMSVKFDESRRLIIKNMTSIEVNACPGSGKTTLLVAKLAILAKKWPFAHKGICVVSHTNVARKEIENKLGNTDVGKALLQYPHFIGTIQSFVDTYISIPYLKNSGNRIRLIDTDIACRRRWKMLQYGSRFYLESQQKNEYVCNPSFFPNTYDIKAKETSKTYQDLVKVGAKSRENGDYTFSEMEQMAVQVMNENKNIALIIRNRFPCVAIDEAQDTTKLHWDILNKIFPIENVIVQSFGDGNQAIFDHNNSGELTSFPLRESYINLDESKRFVNEIAMLANPVAFLENEISGKHPPFLNHPSNTIFLFDESTINLVVKTYADLVLESFSTEELKKYMYEGIWVVGQIHNGNGSFAHDISSYFREYNAECVGNQLKIRYLIDFFRLGLMKKHESRNAVDGLNLFARGIFSLFSRYPKEQVFYRNVPKTFCGLLDFCDKNAQEIRSLFYQLSKQSAITKEKWNIFRDAMFNVFSDLFDSETAKKDMQYFEWSGNVIDSIENKKINTLCFEKEDVSIEINFGSIHSVKGMTHLATLVVETNYRTDNIKNILPWLSKQANKKQPTAGQISRMKCLYVAMTRPMGLVCLAMPKASLKSKDLQSLQKIGWNIKDLTSLRTNNA